MTQFQFANLTLLSLGFSMCIRSSHWGAATWLGEAKVPRPLQAFRLRHCKRLALVIYFFVLCPQ